MLFLADTSSPVSPAQWGVAVLILMQVGQFYFAYRKDQRGNEAANKGDLAVLKEDLTKEIDEVKAETSDLRKSVEKKMEAARVESSTVREQIQTSVKNVEVQQASLLKGQEVAEQAVALLNHKVDVLNARTASHG